MCGCMQMTWVPCTQLHCCNLTLYLSMPAQVGTRMHIAVTTAQWQLLRAPMHTCRESYFGSCYNKMCHALHSRLPHWHPASSALFCSLSCFLFFLCCVL